MKDKKNVAFIVSLVVFTIVLIITKISYGNMQSNEMKKMAKTKWYVNNEEDAKKVGFLELEFGANGNFDIYYADTQVSCMNGKYSIVYGGLMYLKCDDTGFNPPKNWGCKKKSFFKYKLKDDSLELTYKGVKCSFQKQGEEAVKENESESDKLLHNKYFINEEAKMLVTFYSGYMYMYNLKDTKKIFGSNKEVLGEMCFSGEYLMKPDVSKISVKMDDRSTVTKNPMWPTMTEIKDYEFLYKGEGEYKTLVLQYDNKAYEFNRLEQ